MQFVPWKYIADWRCVSCGDCCRLCSVVLSFHEWLQITKNFGVEQTVSGLDKLFIRRRGDGSCVFLGRFSNIHLCGLQYMKPKACKIWPFKILDKPKFGHAIESAYNYGENKLFLYADPMCRGIRYGRPSWEFAGDTVKEFVEIAVGIRNAQFKTTASIGFLAPYSSPRILGARGYLQL